MLELLLLFDPARIPARMAIDQDLAPNDAHHRSVDHVEGVAGPRDLDVLPDRAFARAEAEEQEDDRNDEEVDHARQRAGR